MISFTRAHAAPIYLFVLVCLALVAIAELGGYDYLRNEAAARLSKASISTNNSNANTTAPADATTGPETTTSTSDCKADLKTREAELIKHYSESEAEMGYKPNPKTSWVAKAGILSNATDTAVPIDCSLYQPLDRRIIYFLHIHKAGGTTFCGAARANHWFANFRRNCNANNVTRTRRCCGGNSVEAQQAFANATPFLFVANEWPMFEVMESQRYRYVVMLRKSLDRYKSHYKYFHRAALTSKKVNSPAVRGVGNRFTLKQWLAAQPDNFSLRMICGDRCLHRIKFQLTRDDLMYTLSRLEKFDNIVILEDFERTFKRFTSEVGWEVWPGIKKTPISSLASKKLGGGKSSSVATNVHYPAYTALDDAVYEYATVLFDSNGTSAKNRVTNPYNFSDEVEEALTRYFKISQQSTHNCSTPCCHECVFFFGWGVNLNALLTEEPTER